MEFYLKVNTQLQTSNKMAKGNIQLDDVELKSKKHTDKEIYDSVTIKIGEKGNEAVVKGDCVVIFPSKYEGNTVSIWFNAEKHKEKSQVFGIGVYPRE